MRKRLKNSKFAFLFDTPVDDEFVVIDTETTGLNVSKDEILSIGAIKIKNNKILTSKTFEVYLKPSRNIDTKSIEIHGIRLCDLESAKEPALAIEEFFFFFVSTTVVGYYLEFDIAMLNKYIKPLIGVGLPNETLEVSELYFEKTIETIPQGNIDLRFDTILKNCSIPNMGAHNAVNDAIMTAMIFLKLKHGSYKPKN